MIWPYFPEDEAAVCGQNGAIHPGHPRKTVPDRQFHSVMTRVEPSKTPKTFKGHRKGQQKKKPLNSLKFKDFSGAAFDFDTISKGGANFGSGGFKLNDSPFFEYYVNQSNRILLAELSTCFFAQYLPVDASLRGMLMYNYIACQIRCAFAFLQIPMNYYFLSHHKHVFQRMPSWSCSSSRVL